MTPARLERSSSKQPSVDEKALQTLKSEPLVDRSGSGQAEYAFEPLAFAELPGFSVESYAEAFAAFRRGALALAAGRQALRQAHPAPPGLVEACRTACRLDLDGPSARRFFEATFRPFRVRTGPGGSAGFFTGYYEPVVDGALEPCVEFSAPVLAPPSSFAALPRPLPDRAAINAGALAALCKPVVWLRDAVEVFFVQVQGSARVRLGDERRLRLVYAGRNGRPYTSIGRILIERGEIAADAMSLAAVKGWIRAYGQGEGEAGRTLMQRNQSYVFFSEAPALDEADGPIGGAGVSLTPLRSLAVDRNLYAYGTPVWIDVDLPPSAGGRLRRLTIAQDTGSAIVGQARADIYFGSGDEAGARAGDVRHCGDFVILLAKKDIAPALKDRAR